MPCCFLQGDGAASVEYTMQLVITLSWKDVRKLGAGSEKEDKNDQGHEKCLSWKKIAEETLEWSWIRGNRIKV